MVDIGALIIRIGFWGPLYYNYSKEPPKHSIGNYLGPYILIFIIALINPFKGTILCNTYSGPLVAKPHGAESYLEQLKGLLKRILTFFKGFLKGVNVFLKGFRGLLQGFKGFLRALKGFLRVLKGFLRV